MKEIYEKPEIISVAVRTNSFFAVAKDYDPAEVARALADAGVLTGDDDEEEIPLDPDNPYAPLGS